MKIATRVTASLLALSVLVVLGVVTITWAIRANGGEWWAGSGPENNWPAVIGYGAVYVAFGCFALLLVLVIIRSVRSHLAMRAREATR